MIRGRCLKARKSIDFLLGACGKAKIDIFYLKFEKPDKRRMRFTLQKYRKRSVNTANHDPSLSTP